MLWIALGLNASMAVIETFAGLHPQSTGLLANAGSYAIALAAIKIQRGSSTIFKESKSLERRWTISASGQPNLRLKIPALTLAPLVAAVRAIHALDDITYEFLPAKHLDKKRRWHLAHVLTTSTSQT